MGHKKWQKVSPDVAAPQGRTLALAKVAPLALRHPAAPEARVDVSSAMPSLAFPAVARMVQPPSKGAGLGVLPRAVGGLASAAPRRLMGGTGQAARAQGNKHGAQSGRLQEAFAAKLRTIEEITDTCGPPQPKLPPPPSEMAARLEADTRRLASFGANREGTTEGLSTALNAFERFMAATKYGRLRDSSGANAEESRQAVAYNEQVLASFARWLSLTNSLKTGKPVSAATAQGYVSSVKTHFSGIARQPIVTPAARFLRRTEKGIRLEQGPTEQVRRARLPFGAAKLRVMVKRQGPLPKQGDPERVKQLANERALLILTWALLLRPAEIAYNMKAGPWDPTWALKRSDVKFHKNGTPLERRRHAIVMVTPLKKRQYRRIPQVVPYEGGPMCAYSLLEHLFEVDPVSEADMARTPLVRHADGSHCVPADISKLVHAEAAAQRLEPLHEYTAYCLRIGGATDRRDIGVPEGDLKTAGRWDTEIGQIYARPSLVRLADQSLAAYHASGSDLETAVPGFVQPAWY